MGLRIPVILAIISISISAAAQRRVAAEVEVKTVHQGKVTTVSSKAFCSSSGELIQVFNSPYTYYTVSNPDGEFKLYIPGRNEVYSNRREDFSNKDNILYLFISGHAGDMGLGLYGYRLAKTENEEGGLIKRTYKPIAPGKGASKVELVLENYLPIYLAYYNEGGAVVIRTYLSSYARMPNLVLPQRVTSINYTAKKDSTVVRTVFSNIKTDGKDPMFEFRVPKDAKPTAISPVGK